MPEITPRHRSWAELQVRRMRDHIGSQEMRMSLLFWDVLREIDSVIASKLDAQYPLLELEQLGGEQYFFLRQERRAVCNVM